jgi:(p)ppGpp synthase/HD superfamily hydrolase
MNEFIRQDILAEQIARKAHEGQFRRDGVTPFIVHPERIVNNMRKHPYFNTPFMLSLGWLHDVLEDSTETVESLLAQGVDEYIVSCLLKLTFYKETPYFEYLKEIKEAPICIKATKIFDITDNFTDCPNERQTVKYTNALIYLGT